MASGRVLRQWTGKVISVSPDDALMLCADNEGNSGDALYPSGDQPEYARLVEVSSGKTVGKLPYSSAQNAFFSPDGRFIYAPSFDKPSLVLRVPQLTPVIPLPKLHGVITSQDATRVIGLSPGNKLNRWIGKSRSHIVVDTRLADPCQMYEPAPGVVLVCGVSVRGPNFEEVTQVYDEASLTLKQTIPGVVLTHTPDWRAIVLSKTDANLQSTYSLLDLTASRQNMESAVQCSFGVPKQINVPGILPSTCPTYDKALAISPDGKHIAYATDRGLTCITI